jgi:5-methylcytosine-specific restriction enzyme A
MGRAPKHCGRAGCLQLVRGRTYCDAHAPQPWAGSDRRTRLPTDWPSRRRAVLERDGRRCYTCGGAAGEVDHVRAGDDHRLENLAAICTACHKIKSAREGGIAAGARRDSAGRREAAGDGAAATAGSRRGEPVWTPRPPIRTRPR